MSWLVGPVFSYDLLRMSRRKRYFVLRFTLCLLLFALFYLCYSSFAAYIQARAAGGVVINGVYYSSGLVRGNYLSDLSREAARFGYQFFIYFLLVQIGLVLVITPVVVAGTLAEEKQRQTLEYLLATDLSNGEIVLGKLLSRLLVMATLVLGCFPILAFAQWFGGVAPELILLGLAACLATLFGTAGLALWCAVRGQRLRQMLFWTYGLLMAYFAAWFAVAYVYFEHRSDFTPESLERLRLVLAGLGLFTPLGALATSMDEVNRAGSIHTGVWRYLACYCTIQVMLGLLFALLATRQLRTAYLRQQASEAQRKSRLARRKLEPVWQDHPLAWKEVRLEPGFRLRWWGWGIVLLLTGYFVGLPLLLLIQVCDTLPVVRSQWWMGALGRTYFHDVQARLPWFTAATMLAAMVVAGVRGAATLAVERDQQTWDTLMSSPVTLGSVLWAKLWGCVRPLWPMLLFATLLSTSGWLLYENFGHTPGLLACSFLVFVVFAAFLGLCFSAASPSAPRAVIATLLLLAFVTGAPILAMGLFTYWMGMSVSGDLAEGVIAILNVAEWIWVPALVLVLILILVRLLPRRVQSGTYQVLRALGIGLVGFVITLLLLLSLAASFGIGLTLGELAAFLSPPFVFAVNVTYLNHRLDHESAASVTLMVTILYALAAWMLGWWALRRLRRASGRVDGTRPPKKRKGDRAKGRKGEEENG